MTSIHVAVRRLAASVLLVAGAQPSWALPAGAAAEILSIQGTGEQRRAEVPAWEPARVLQALAAGDFVRTRDGARMALLFADQTQIRLHQNTTLQVRAIAKPGQPLTDVLLSVGRAWAQTRRPADMPLQMQTPSATAGIRGTDWDIEVDADGRTQVTVLSGIVLLSNAQGEVAVGPHEAAVAEKGRAPVKILLARPADRVQWVNALVPDPRRWLSSGTAEPGLAAIATLVEGGRFTEAESGLAALPRPLSPAATLLLADLHLVQGRFDAAITTLRDGLAAQPRNPELRARLAHAQLLADRVADSAQTLGPPAAGEDAALLIARGTLARRQGDAQATLSHFGSATRAAPGDDRAWYGLGSAQAEREDTVPARASLLRALELRPDGPGYRGELGLLDALRDDLPAAEAAFAQALAAQPGDYVALTGLGLVRLKQGRPAEALEALLRAGVMEPRYARARTWTGVAYYQLGRRSDAVATLRQAAALDDKDPLPHLLLAQVHTDGFRAGDAVDASRAAVERMPFLKSLNQLANDQQGRTSFGASLAFFGMEDWALELAQQGYYPYWGGSHLFLADRYRGEFSRNSELFQGFLSDPLAFGASPRFASLLQQPGHHGVAAWMADREGYRLVAPSITLNGLANDRFPIAWFVKHQAATGSRFPIDMGVSSLPAMHDPSGTADARARVLTLGLGARPTDRLGLFAYLNDADISLRGRNRVDLFGDGGEPTDMDSHTRQAALGLSWRWGPQAQTWAKLGYAEDHLLVSALPTVFREGPLGGTLGLYAAPLKRYADLQLRHTEDLADGTRLSLGYEHVKERQQNAAAAAGPLSGSVEGMDVNDMMVFAGDNAIDRRFHALTVAAQRPLGPAWTVDGALTANWIRHRVHGQTQMALLGLEVADDQRADRDDTERVLAPRLGVVWRPTPALSVRVAYQDWLRPLSVGTLNSVDTAGIPVEDQLVEAGGRHRRKVIQAGWTAGPATFVTARLDHVRVRNPEEVGVDLRTPSLPFLEELRNAQLMNLSTSDVLEEAPSFQQGTLRVASAGVNHLFGRRWSGYAKYWYQDGRTRLATSAGTASEGRIPWIPRHALALGATWASESRLYLSGRLTYRSQRFEDEANLTPRKAGWSLDLMGFWESADKRWVLGASAAGLLAPRSSRHPHRYLLDARYRF